MPGLGLHERRLLLGATLPGLGAPRPEPVPARWVHRGRYVALEDDAQPIILDVGVGNGCPC